MLHVHIFQYIDTLTSRVPSVGIWLWGSQVEGAGRSGGCSGAWPHTVLSRAQTRVQRGHANCPLVTACTRNYHYIGECMSGKL